MNTSNKNLKSTTIFCLSTALFFTLSYNSVFATPKPNHLTIVSDSALIKYREKTNIFTGNVHIKSDDTILDGDKVITQQNQHREFTSIVSYGDLAHYNTIIKPNDPPLDALAKIIKFFPPKHKAILIGKAFAKQGPNTISGPIINYNTLYRVISSTANKLGRTHIMINNKGDMKVASK
jgi:lipopolysaccharide export system protein LptA